ncbi:MAG: Conservative hypothetical protein probably involved in hydantoin, pyrimidine utilization [uncultured Thermoleophilia bacterium]|uniref:DUF917 domain-containing protein n=1 Tax=uncultured Thermoleophilia bacterium TaxID=1497501 RepID=A0A6J4U924_9ACTN|nr:MAG: Conservative hypothetical protein probably involved in hydantoin, pyrimidine utilization [uncultured Thermoleophilia bacterium]
MIEPVRRIDAEVVPFLARGCAILGTGGGGEVYTGSLMSLQALEEFGPIDVVTLDDLPDDGLLMPIGMMGAPTVGIEKIPSGREGVVLRDHVERLTGRRVVAAMPSEIGGSNGLLPVAWAAQLGLPLVDADSMGRAFPELQQVSQHVVGRRPDLIVLTDVHGNLVTLGATSGEWAERVGRAVTVAFGGSSAMADFIMPVGEARGAVIEGSISRAVAIGRAVSDSADPLGALVEAVGAVRLIEGRVVDVERRTTGGFARGTVVVDGTGEDRGRALRIEIQNENLVAFDDGAVRACVPDLITVVDAVTADAIATEMLRYGQRVAVVAFPCDPLWRTARGIETAGPRAFGYDFDYVPIEVAGARA